MAAPQTHTVSRAFSSGPPEARLHWALVKGYASPLKTDDLLHDGASVVIRGDRAVRR